MLAVVALLFLAGAPGPQADQVAPAIIEARPKTADVTPSEGEIVAQLNQLVRDEPNRTVCFRPPAPTGTRLAKATCRTLAEWYQFERDRDTQTRVAYLLKASDARQKMDPTGAASGPPYELVDMLKARYRSPKVRASAMKHARDRAGQADKNADIEPS